MTVPAILGLAGSVFGGLIGQHGQQQANAANLAIAREQMAFQERMRRTQYQTAVQDMAAAGLNPALAYQQGGAGTPTGSTGAPQQNTGQFMGNALSSGISNAISVYQQLQQIQKTAQDIRQQRNAADVSDAETAAKLVGIRGPDGKPVNPEAYRLPAQQAIAAQIATQLRNNRIGADTEATQVEQAKADVIATLTGARESAAGAKLKELQQPGASAEANFYRTGYGKATPYINSATDVLGTLIGLTGKGAAIHQMYRPDITTHEQTDLYGKGYRRSTSTTTRKK